MRYAAFFRNLNLGRKNCPDRVQFEAAFTAGGASAASSFLTNGTLVFEVGAGRRVRKVLANACAVLHGSRWLAPSESRRRDVRVVRCTDAEVFSVCLKIGNTPGSPNAFLEQSLDRPATTRNWNTVVRLVQRHADRS